MSRRGLDTDHARLAVPDVWETTVEATFAPGGACDRMTLAFY